MQLSHPCTKMFQFKHKTLQYDITHTTVCMLAFPPPASKHIRLVKTCIRKWLNIYKSFLQKQGIPKMQKHTQLTHSEEHDIQRWLAVEPQPTAAGPVVCQEDSNTWKTSRTTGFKVTWTGETHEMQKRSKESFTCAVQTPWTQLAICPSGQLTGMKNKNKAPRVNQRWG